MFLVYYFVKVLGEDVGKKNVIWFKRCLSKKCGEEDILLFQHGKVRYEAFLLGDTKLTIDIGHEIQKRGNEEYFW